MFDKYQLEITNSPSIIVSIRTYRKAYNPYILIELNTI